MNRYPSILAMILMALVAVTAFARDKAAPEFPVNTTTLDDQSEAAVATVGTGGFVAAWHSLSQDGSKFGIFARRFDSAGDPAGDEFQVNTTTQNDQVLPSVAVAPGGAFVLVWASDGQDGDSFGIYGRQYDASGSPSGGEFQVNAHTENAQYRPRIAMDGGGNFVVVWESYEQDGDSAGIFGRRFDAASGPAGDEFQINIYTADEQSAPDVAMDDDGDFVVVWQSYLQDSPDYSVYGQRYDADGNPVGAEERINQDLLSEHSWPAVAMDAAGNFVVAWQTGEGDGSGYGVLAKGFAADGSPPADPEFQVNTYTLGDQQYVDVSMNAAGDFVVTWQSRDQDGDDQGIYAQRFNAAREALGGEIAVNVTWPDAQKFPAVAMRTGGGFVALWQSEEEIKNDFDIIGRLFLSCETDIECDDDLFCNGQERCDQGVCVPGPEPCDEDENCNEETDTCDPLDDEEDEETPGSDKDGDEDCCG